MSSSLKIATGSTLKPAAELARARRICGEGRPARARVRQRQAVGCKGGRWVRCHVHRLALAGKD